MLYYIEYQAQGSHLWNVLPNDVSTFDDCVNVIETYYDQWGDLYDYRIVEQ